MSKQLRAVIEQFTAVQPDYVYIEGEDYQTAKVPAVLKRSSLLSLLWVVRSKIKDIDFSEYKGVVITGFETALLLMGFIARKPSILYLDTTPVLARKLVAQEQGTFSSRVNVFIITILYRILYWSVFRNITYFLTVSDWCAESLHDDFGVESKRIFITYSSIDMQEWKPKEKEPRKKLKLLFVGNDFRRKGGPFLLKIFKHYLKNQFDLTIVSNDPYCRKAVHQQEGVRMISGLTHTRRKELVEIFQDADIFVFPTFREQLGFVIAEAMAVGLPVVARDVGGIPELVIDQHNGYLMSYKSGEKEWAQKIKFLGSREGAQLLRQMGQNSRRIAEEKFCPERFNRTVSMALEGMFRC